jgi:hypothetical protein
MTKLVELKAASDAAIDVADRLNESANKRYN